MLVWFNVFISLGSLLGLIDGIVVFFGVWNVCWMFVSGLVLISL